MDAREARTAQVCVAPVLQEDAATESVPEVDAPVSKVRSHLRQEVAIPAVDAVRPPDPVGLRAWSPVDAMFERLRLLHGPASGTEGQFWKRLLGFEEEEQEKEEEEDEEEEEEARSRRQGLSERERLALTKVCKMPSFLFFQFFITKTHSNTR